MRAWQQHIRAREAATGMRLLGARRQFNRHLCGGSNGTIDHTLYDEHTAAAANSAGVESEYHRLAAAFYAGEDGAEVPPITQEVQQWMVATRVAAMRQRDRANIRQINVVLQWLAENPRLLTTKRNRDEGGAGGAGGADGADGAAASKRARGAEPDVCVPRRSWHPEGDGRCREGHVPVACTDVFTQEAFAAAQDEQVVQLHDFTCYTREQLEQRRCSSWDGHTKTHWNKRLTPEDRTAVLAFLGPERLAAARAVEKAAWDPRYHGEASFDAWWREGQGWFRTCDAQVQAADAANAELAARAEEEEDEEDEEEAITTEGLWTDVMTRIRQDGEAVHAGVANDVMAGGMAAMWKMAIELTCMLRWSTSENDMRRMIRLPVADEELYQVHQRAGPITHPQMLHIGEYDAVPDSALTAIGGFVRECLPAMMGTPSHWPIEYLVRCPAKLRALQPRFEDPLLEQNIVDLPHLPACMELWAAGARHGTNYGGSFGSPMEPNPATLRQLRELGLTESMYPTPVPVLDAELIFWDTDKYTWTGPPHPAPERKFYEDEEFVNHLQDTYTLDWPLVSRMLLDPGRHSSICFGDRVPTRINSARRLLHHTRTISDALGVAIPDADLSRYITAALWAAAVNLRDNKRQVLLDAQNVPLQPNTAAPYIGTPWRLLQEHVQPLVLELIAGWKRALHPPTEPGTSLWGLIKTLLKSGVEDEEAAQIFTGLLRGQRRDDEAEEALGKVGELRRLCMNLREQSQIDTRERPGAPILVTNWV
jgi:hypothetical protein